MPFTSIYAPSWHNYDYGPAHAEGWYRLGRIGPFSYGGALYAIGRYYLAPYHEIEVLKSTDEGASWIVQDNANAPRGAADGQSASSLDTDTVMVGNILYVLHIYKLPDGYEYLRIARFDMNTNTWLASVTSTVQVSYLTNLGIRIFITQFGADRLVALYGVNWTGAGDQLKTAILPYTISTNTWESAIELTSSDYYYGPLGIVAGTDYIHCFMVRNSALYGNSPALCHRSVNNAMALGDLQVMDVGLGNVTLVGKDAAQMGQPCMHGTKVVTCSLATPSEYIKILWSESQSNPVWSSDSIVVGVCPILSGTGSTSRPLPMALFSEEGGVLLTTFEVGQPNNNKIVTRRKTILDRGYAWTVTGTQLDVSNDPRMPAPSGRVIAWPAIARLSNGIYGVFFDSYAMDGTLFNYSTYKIIYGQMETIETSGRNIGLIPGRLLSAGML